MKRTLFIVGILIVIFLGIYLVLANKDIQRVREGGGEATLRDYFPFGKGSGTRIKDVLEDIGGGKTQEEQLGEEIPIEQEAPALRKIYAGHVAGYGYFMREVFAGEDSLDEEVTLIPPVGVFERELRLGSTGEDVKRLQQTLNACTEFVVATSGVGSKGQETTTLGQKTVDAINKFQRVFKNEILTPRNLTEPTGVVDELTRKKLSAPYECILGNTIESTIPKKLSARLVDKENGNIFDVILDSGDQYQVTNTTIPRVHEAYITNGGKNVLLRYLKEDELTIASFYGKVPEQKLGDDISEAPLPGTILEDDIKDVALSPDTTELYLQTAVGGNSTGVIRNIDTKKQSVLWQHPYSEWLAQWVNKNLVTLTTKASGYVPGFVYSVDTVSGVFEKVFGGIGGLTTNTSPDGTQILFSGAGNQINTSFYNIGDRKAFDVSIDTLAEKCVWLPTNISVLCAVPKYVPEGVFPDNWYQGLISFDDSFWQIDSNRLLDDEELFDPSDYTTETIDAVNLSISPDGKYLLFKNKIDDSLWVYSL